MESCTERDTVSQLIDICRDSALGFTLAADQVADADLKSIFAHMALQREVFKTELLPYARVGRKSDEQGTTCGSVHRLWMAVRDALTGDRERAAVVEALRGERVAANRYARALSEDLPPTARPLIERQHRAICDGLQDLDALLAQVTAR